MQLDHSLQACRVGGPEARDSYWLLLALQHNVVLEWRCALVMPTGWLSCHGSAVQGLWMVEGSATKVLVVESW